MNTRPRIALLLVGVKDLKGGGGAERYFVDVFEHYRRRGGAFDLTLVTDAPSLARLREIGRLPLTDGVVLCPPPVGIIGVLRQTLNLVRLARSVQFDLFHIVLPAQWYLPFMWLRPWWQRNGSPRICANVMDCTIAHSWFDARLRRDRANGKAYWLYRLFLESTCLDGVFTWYQLFRERFSERLPGNPKIVAGRYCCVDTERFRPAPKKDNLVVHVGRLVAQKRPLLFVEAIREALSTAPELCAGWRFLMYGKGPREDEVRDAIDRFGLAGRVELGHAGELQNVLAESKVLVSTQDFENFSSLAILEAMAAGNAIIARDVGQTSYFVHDGENGYLASDDTAHGLAQVLLRYMSEREQHPRFAECSRRIATKEHCMENVFRDLEDFWEAVLCQQPTNTA